jgi:hypothetical protein
MQTGSRFRAPRRAVPGSGKRTAAQPPQRRARERGTPFSGWSKAKSALDTASGVSSWWLHDLRRTLATGLQRLGVRLEVTEAVLNQERKSGWCSRDLSKGRGETRSTRRMVCAPSRRGGRQAACRKGVAIQPSGLRRDVAESTGRTVKNPGSAPAVKARGEEDWARGS